VFDFIDYYAHVSASIDSDNVYSILMENVWNLDNKDNYETLPFAGSKDKVMIVDHK
jgi:hypothetical protein